MNHVIELRGNFDSTPCCWQNFIKDFNKRWQSDLIEIPNEEAQHFDAVCQELQESWRAELVGDNWDCPLDIMFNSSKDYTFFVLRWS